MPAFTPRQLVLLVLLTLIWGVNWPIMKLGVTHFPPLSFRAISMWIGLLVVLCVLRMQKQSLSIAREHWGTLARLTLFNMVIWHCLVIVAMPLVSSGRAAILGYTMPIFSAVIGSLIYRDRLAGRAWCGVAAAFLGVMLLLWHEFGALGSRPTGALMILFAAFCWAIGTQMMRRASMPVPVLTMAFWMMLITALVLSLGAVSLERSQWHLPGTVAVGTILFNGLLVVGFAQVVWFVLARSLPPVASTLSVMFIPVLGVFSGAWWLNEVLHWQDWTAVALMVLAIATVLWPSRKAV
ncbi:DMT family transporter [Comamonas sp. NoAH]|uniref:DMT family transporter n=1 Tax=Comamonas halotolerans TaxID=3041496 RepID=UPI0024E18406|nr:DMT family transporter [Comamonas sp. NoAH]